jgi:hypothetical protein
MRANREIQDIIGNNAFLFAIVVAGIVIMAIGYTPYVETLVVLGTAFIISSAVGIYMMQQDRWHENYTSDSTSKISSCIK